MSGFITSRRSAHRKAEQGYILLTLVMLASVLVITLAAGAPKLTHELRRDREEELLHRGVQYSRAVRRFYKKFGRYPVSLDELENTNNLRFLRQRYKDPLTGKDFKLLHFGEVKMAFGAAIAGGAAPGTPVADLAAYQNKGANQQSQSGEQITATNATDENSSSSSSSSPSSSSPSSSSRSSGPNGSLSAAQGPAFPGTAGAFSGQVFGGGPIVGVVSTSNKQSIREFNKKNHYNDWQFIYDPSTDRGGLLNMPAQPALQTPAAAQGIPANQPGLPTLGGPQNAPGIPQQQQPSNPQQPNQPQPDQQLPPQ